MISVIKNWLTSYIQFSIHIHSFIKKVKGGLNENGIETIESG
jgi:hypothetical protein